MSVKKIRVRINYVVEVDVADWNLAYGRSTTPAETREDVKSYFENQISQAACWDEVEGGIVQ